MPVKPVFIPAKVARRYVSSTVIRMEPRYGPSAVPIPPMIVLSANRTERSTENTYAGSTKPTYCAHSVPHTDVRAALTVTAITLSARVAIPSASAASSSSRTPAS